MLADACPASKFLTLRSSMTQHRPLSLLIVEDEAMIRMLLADMVEELGHSIVGQAARLNEALELISSGIQFDVAILDLNLGGDSAAPIAEVIEQKAIPFIFATGYGKAGIPQRFQERPFLQKPYVIDSLASALASISKAVP
jgi:CheY-like chemotaxis protein